MTKFEEYCERKREAYGNKFISPKGEDFIAAFNNGPDYRIKVSTAYPSGNRLIRWGYVGITTGWNPTFLLMRRRGQYGSSDVLSENDEVIGRKWLPRVTWGR